jgi:cell division protein FtsB
VKRVKGKFQGLAFFIVVLVLVTSISLWFTVFGDKGWIAYRHMLQVENQLRQNIAVLNSKNQALVHEIFLIHHDRDYLERMVRAKFNMGKPDELVFRFD